MNMDRGKSPGDGSDSNKPPGPSKSKRINFLEHGGNFSTVPDVGAIRWVADQAGRILGRHWKQDELTKNIEQLLPEKFNKEEPLGLVSSPNPGVDQSVSPEQKSHDESSLADLPQKILELRRKGRNVHREGIVRALRQIGIGEFAGFERLGLTFEHFRGKFDEDRLQALNTDENGGNKKTRNEGLRKVIETIMSLKYWKGACAGIEPSEALNKWMEERKKEWLQDLKKKHEKEMNKTSPNYTTEQNLRRKDLMRSDWENGEKDRLIIWGQKIQFEQLRAYRSNNVKDAQDEVTELNEQKQNDDIDIIKDAEGENSKLGKKRDPGPENQPDQFEDSREAPKPSGSSLQPEGLNGQFAQTETNNSELHRGNLDSGLITRIKQLISEGKLTKEELLEPNSNAPKKDTLNVLSSIVNDRFGSFEQLNLGLTFEFHKKSFSETIKEATELSPDKVKPGVAYYFVNDIIATVNSLKDWEKACAGIEPSEALHKWIKEGRDQYYKAKYGDQRGWEFMEEKKDLYPSVWQTVERNQMERLRAWKENKGKDNLPHKQES